MKLDFKQLLLITIIVIIAYFSVHYYCSTFTFEDDKFGVDFVFQEQIQNYLKVYDLILILYLILGYLILLASKKSNDTRDDILDDF